MRVLRCIAQKGTTIVVVLHQPRYEIFEQFDNVIFLGNGGKPVYMGKTTKVLQYFESLGFYLPQNVNPADFFMDIIGGTIKNLSDTHFQHDRLPEIWNEHKNDKLLSAEYSMATNEMFTQVTNVCIVFYLFCIFSVTKF